MQAGAGEHLAAICQPGGRGMSHQLYRGDLPEGLDFGSAVAIDTEAMGLNPHRDRLCLVQLSAGDGNAHLVQFAPDSYEAPRLKRLLADPSVLKLFHFARFDLAMLYRYLGVMGGRFIARRSPHGSLAPLPTSMGCAICARICLASTCRSSSRARTGERRH